MGEANRRERAVPFPPANLMARVGHGPIEDLQTQFDQIGAATKAQIVRALPPDWSLDGKRVLDFGCGSGRLLRQFVPEANRTDEFWASEIDEASVHWLQQNLSPPFTVVLNDESPPIPAPDGHFDLIYAVSVFTHITGEWAPWVLEMHRLLRPGGLLIASYLGEGMIELLLGEAWDEHRIGLAIAGCGTRWDEGGPLAFMSPWWIRAHWGRAFDIVSIEPAAQSAAGHAAGHGWIVARRREVRVSRQELESPAPDEHREYDAAIHNVALLAREMESIRAKADWWHATAVRAEGRADELARLLEQAYTSRSWRITAPLRGIAARARNGRSSRRPGPRDGWTTN